MANRNEPIGPGKVPIPKMKGGLGQFFKDVGVEMRKVIWPTRHETVRLTVAVLFVCVLFVVYLWVAGFLVDRAVTFIEKGSF